MSATLNPDTIIAQVAPVGGIVTLMMTSSDAIGPWSLTRDTLAADGTTVTATALLYATTSGVFDLPQWLDTGDGLNGTLDQQTNYAWSFSTLNGTTVTPALMPQGRVAINRIDFVDLFKSVLDAGFASSAAVNGVGVPDVLDAMPLTGVPPLPIVVINETLVEQGDTPVGHGLNEAGLFENSYIIQEQVKRRLTVHVLSENRLERDLLRDAVIAFFKASMIPILESYGNNVTNGFQASSSQISGDRDSPGFYFTDIALHFSGTFSVRVTTNYGLMASVGALASTPSASEIP